MDFHVQLFLKLIDDGFKWIAIPGVLELLIMSCEEYEIFKISCIKIYIQYWLLVLAL